MACEWFKFYSADYLLDAKVASLSLEAQGVLVRIWCLIARDGSIPEDTRTLAKLLAIPHQTLNKVWGCLQVFFEFENGKLTSKRMVLEQARYEEIAEKRRLIGSLGGKKKVANAKAIARDDSKQLLSEENREEKRRDNPPTPLAGGPIVEAGSPAGPGAMLGDPGGSPVKPKRKTRAQRDQDLAVQDIPAEAIKLGHALVSSWRKKDPDGREIRCEVDLLIERLARIHERQPRYTWAVLEESARAYLASDRKACKAPQYFFTLTPDLQSGGIPPFKGWADAAVRKIEARAQTPEVTHA